MDEKTIRKYAKLMKELELSGLEIEENGCTVRLERTVQTPAYRIVEKDVSALAPQSAGSNENETKPSSDEKDIYSVKSPMVGVFYAAPAENAEPFIKVGDHVEAGDTLCIVEAMKLMNEILSEVSGEVVEICAENGQVVDYGCELFRIRR